MVVVAHNGIGHLSQLAEKNIDGHQLENNNNEYSGVRSNNTIQHNSGQPYKRQSQKTTAMRMIIMIPCATMRRMRMQTVVKMIIV